MDGVVVVGAKTGVLVFTDADVPEVLRGATVVPDRERAAALVRRVHPGHTVDDAGDSALGDAVYPPEDILYVTSVDGTDVLCDQRFMIDYPSRLPPHLLDLAAGRRVILHAMHSVVDWLAFAIWDTDGTIVRSLSLSPDGGIAENIGGPLEFERPYWAGQHPVVPVSGWPDEGPYPLPFHPLDLGEEALRALVGFTIEGLPQPSDVDAYAVPVVGFRVTDPTGAEQAARTAVMAQARAQMGPPRRFRLVDGVFVEIDEF